MAIIMATNQIDINTCDKMCGLHEYSLVSRNLHVLPLEFLVSCAKRIIQISSGNETSYKRCISKRDSLMRCDGTLVLSLSVDTRSNNCNVSDDVSEFPGRLAPQILLDWHFGRTEWIKKNPAADTNVIDKVLKLQSVLELLEMVHLNASLEIPPVLDRLETMPIDELVI